MLNDTIVPTTRLPCTILLVEDEEPIRLFLTEFFQDCGCQTLEAATVAQAKRALADAEVDVVFSDVNMPGGETGFDLEKWVRSHYPGTKVLLTSGFPQEPKDIKGLCETLIPKPYTGAAVLQRIRGLLSGEQVQS